MKKVSLTCSVFLLLSIIVFASFAASCGGGGGGVSAARGGNNAGKGGIIGGGGEATITINPSQSPTLNEINWQTIDFKIKIGNRAPFTKTLNAGENINLQLSEEDGLAVGETIDIEAKITNAAGLEFEAFSGVQTLAGGNNNIVMTVGRKVPLNLAAGVTVEGGATYVILTKNGATLPKATTTNPQYFSYWKKGDGTKIYNNQLSPADFTTLSTLTPVFVRPYIGYILCADKSVAASISELNGRTPFGYICNVKAASVGGYVNVLSNSETKCKLNDEYFAYTAGGFDYSNTANIEGKRNGFEFKAAMIAEYGEAYLYSTSPAYQYLKTLPNLPDGTPVNWTIPTARDCESYFKTSANTTLTGIGAETIKTGNSHQYMTCNMKAPSAGEACWSLAYYAKGNDDLDTILTQRDDYTTYSKWLRAIGQVSLP